MTPVAVNGVAYNVEVEETCEGRRRPPLVLLHGFTGSARTWDPHIARFNTAYSTVAIDLLGHGLSSAPADPERYRVERAVEDIVAVLDLLRLEQVTLLGYSMGGRVALHFTLFAPERVRALVLESASPGIADLAERRRRVESDSELADSIEREGVPAFVDRWERNPLFTTQERLPEGARKDLRSQRLMNRATGLANSLRGMGAGVQAPLWDRLGELQTPTLLIAGGLDPKFMALALEMRALIPDTTLGVVPLAGHAVHLEQPDTYDHCVREFLEITIGPKYERRKRRWA